MLFLTAPLQNLNARVPPPLAHGLQYVDQFPTLMDRQILRAGTKVLNAISAVARPKMSPAVSS